MTEREQFEKAFPVPNGGEWSEALRQYCWLYTAAPHQHDAFWQVWQAARATPKAPKDDAEQLARKFHETYERLAPHYGYETREETRAFDADSPNGRLMIAVCREIRARAIPDTHRVVSVETLLRWRSGLVSGNQSYCLVPPAEIQAIIEDKENKQ